MQKLLCLILAVLSGAVTSLPEPVAPELVEPRCGSFLAPDGFYLLKEDDPDAWIPVEDGLFKVSQDAGVNWGRARNREYILVHFPPTPYGTYGCELHWNIMSNTLFEDYVGSHQLDVKITTGYYPPFRPTWNSIISGPPSTLASGVFGTVNAVAPTRSVIGGTECNNGPPEGMVGGGFGLAFVFKLADWIEQGGQAAATSFHYGGVAGAYTGPFLNYGC